MSEDPTTTGNGDDSKTAKQTSDTTAPKVILSPSLQMAAVEDIGRKKTELATAPVSTQEETPKGVDLAPSQEGSQSSASRSPLTFQTIFMIIGGIVVAVVLLRNCAAFDKLETSVADLQADQSKTQIDLATTKGDVTALKTGVDNLNKKVDPMIQSVEKLAGTIDALDKKVQGLDDSKADKSDLRNKADRAEVLKDRRRLTIVEKKLETPTVVAKEPAPMPKEEKATHKLIIRHVEKKVPVYKQ